MNCPMPQAFERKAAAPRPLVVTMSIAAPAVKRGLSGNFQLKRMLEGKTRRFGYATRVDQAT